MANMTFGVNIIPSTNNTYTLGNSTNKWKLFTNSINDLITVQDDGLLIGSLDVGERGIYFGDQGVYYNVTMDSGNTCKTHLFAQGLEWYWNGDLRTMLFQGSSGLVIRVYDPNDSSSYDNIIQTYRTEAGAKDIYLRYDTHISERLLVTKQANFYADAEVYYNLTVDGNLIVRGTISATNGVSIYTTSNSSASDALTCGTTITPIEGQLIYVILNKAMSGSAAATIQFGSGSAIPIYKDGSNRLTAAYGANMILALLYHNSAFYLINGALVA